MTYISKDYEILNRTAHNPENRRSKVRILNHRGADYAMVGTYKSPRNPSWQLLTTFNLFAFVRLSETARGQGLAVPLFDVFGGPLVHEVNTGCSTRT
jgi:hypothetical protein